MIVTLTNEHGDELRVFKQNGALIVEMVVDRHVMGMPLDRADVEGLSKALDLLSYGAAE